MKKNALLALFACLVLSNFSCDKCKDVACFTPPSGLNFQLVDKDSGEDLVANGSFDIDEISIVPMSGQKAHDLQTSENGGAHIFSDAAIGWDAGAENSSYELRLNPSTALPFTYETKAVNKDCCTFYELVSFSFDAIEIIYNDTTGVYQLKI